MSGTDQSQELIKGMERGLLQWYGFGKSTKVLYIGERVDALAEMLAEETQTVVCTLVE